MYDNLKRPHISIFLFKRCIPVPKTTKYEYTLIGNGVNLNIYHNVLCTCQIC